MTIFQHPINEFHHSFGEVVATADGSLTVKHADADECYHSTTGALFEAETLYIHHSGLRSALRLEEDSSLIHVLDVGMGLAYNALSTIKAWQEAPNPPALSLVSLEVNAALVEAIAAATAPWQRGWSQEWLEWGSALVQVSPFEWHATLFHPMTKSKCSWRVLIGDGAALDLQEQDVGPFHFIWQDPFSPARNPVLWTAAWFTKLKTVAAPTTLLMTYSVARIVRDNLAAAGWQPERFNTGLQKRQWLRARLNAAGSSTT